METIDLSASRCYPVELPNQREADDRLRLDVRTGAAIKIFGSRIYAYGGSTKQLSLSTEFTISDLQEEMSKQGVEPRDCADSLSSECFELSLINHKWKHLAVQGDDKPVGRMYHAIMIFDNYIYVHGGIGFTPEGQPQVLNDVWRFDILERKWTCLYPLGNDVVEPRFEHALSLLDSFAPIGRKHFGMLICGGLNIENKFYLGLSTLDFTSEKWDYYPDLQSEELGCDGPTCPSVERPQPLAKGYRYSKNPSILCELQHFPKEIVVYDKAAKDNQEPLVHYMGPSLGERQFISQPVLMGDHDNVPRGLEFANIHGFGENLIIAGFTPDTKRMVAFIHNLRSKKWMRLQIKCFDPQFTHRLTRGFVWESHHEMLFLGSRTFEKSTPPCTQLFDLYLFVPLPFTSTFGIETEVLATEPSAEELEAAPHMSREGSVMSFTTTDSKESGGDFDEYARQIAPQLEVSNIPAAFPATAVALSKNAFERQTSLTDFELVSADGTSVSVPLVMLRRRWGKKFDAMLMEAYAWSYVDSEIPEAMDILHGSRGSRTTPSSRRSTPTSSRRQSTDSVNTGPQFRYPFQPASKMSYSITDSRHNSITMTQLPPRRGSLDSELRRNSEFRSRQSSYTGPSGLSHNSAGRLPELSSRGNSIVGKSSSSRHGSITPSLQQSLPFSMDDLPPQLPMPPTMSPRTSRVDESEATIQVPPTLELGTDPLDISLARSTSQPPALSARGISSTPPRTEKPIIMTPAESEAAEVESYSSLEDSIEFPEPDESAIDYSKLPRALQFPYSGSSVKAFAEYLCSGQMGTNWKIFPTASELLLIAKRYDVPLLFNLVLELLFVIIARKEVALLEDAANLKALVASKGLSTQDNWFGSGSATDRFEKCLSTLDDGVTDFVLFKQASNVGHKRSTSTLDKDEVDPLEASSEEPTVTATSTDNADKNSSDSDGPDNNADKYDTQTTLGLLNDTGYSTNEGEESWPTFKQLVAPGSKACSDTIVRMLIEIGALASDMKLMIRALNVQEMSKQLAKYHAELDEQLAAATASLSL